MLYCEARLLRAGLANKLFPWARARIFARTHNVPMLATRWSQVPFGTLLRREKDLRVYADLFDASPNSAGSLRSSWVRLRAKPIAEPQSPADAVIHADGLGLVVFSGMREQFVQINGWHNLLREELTAITRPVWRERAQSVPAPFIAIHVRRGDFRRAETSSDAQKSDNTTTPIGWFIDTLRSVRAQSGEQLPAIVTSDGSDAELADLLAQNGVTRADTGSAIGDMLLLSRASVLLASGSSFSAWASFLGQVPTLSHPGQGLTRLFGLKSQGAFLGEFDPEGPAGLDRLFETAGNTATA